MLITGTRPNKKISMFQVTGLKSLGSVGTHFFFKHLPLKMHEVIYFSRKPEKKILGFTSKRYGWVTLNTDIFLFGPMHVNWIRIQHGEG